MQLPFAGADSRDSRFECNICLDHVNEPVVTRCGHLFCWPCLYRWLNTNHTECPVCKAGVSCDNVIPLYGRGQDPVDPRTKTVDRSAENIPERPTAERPRAERPRGVFGEGFGFGGGGGGGANEFAQGGMTITAGFGFFPSLFALQFQRFTSAPAGAQAPADSEDAAQQAMLSRILLALGTFVVACLLLF
ncbi:hypothetical protein JKP88DRAFT_284769 [Tribonema minus]|uniref:RING-type E3 ubiquitin transferase n=1 Tax=Tribonema minus TaxID=303371 RepID=A0A835ZFB6_9STRA|nr:hypothetical protein JKP88DRAFT_284769 [Tribonema minus]